jgi:hypothetical protein
MFCASGLIFGGYEGVRSRFHVFSSRIRGCQVSFSAVQRASGSIFKFCALRLVYGCTEGVRSCFRRYRGHQRPFSCFAIPDSFSAVPRASSPIFSFCVPDSISAVPRASGPVFMFCAPERVFGGAECVGSCFHLLRARNGFGGPEGNGSRFNAFRAGTIFRWYRGRRVLFSCFERPDSFSAVPRASGPVIMFCSPGLIFGSTKGVGTYFLVLRSLTHFRRFRVRRIPFSSFACPDSFSAVPKASGPFSCFERPDSFPAVLRASGPDFMFRTPGIIFGGTDCVRSRFHVLHSLTRFRRYRGRRVPFSSFARPDSFSAVPRASGPFFMFCVLRHVFGGVECLRSRFHV